MAGLSLWTNFLAGTGRRKLSFFLLLIAFQQTGKFLITLRKSAKISPSSISFKKSNAFG